MKRIMWSVLLILVILAGLGIGFSTAVSAAGPAIPSIFPSGAVYSMTNDTAGNAVVMFNRGADGKLTKVGSILTQGNGMGSALDPLGSQGSLALTLDRKWLLAVNAGSNTITVFKVEDGWLDFVEMVGSGGTMPVSLTVSWNRVFVLNAGGTPNITGFNLNFKGDLDPISGSTRWLGAGGYHEVGFNPWGNRLVVTDGTPTAANRILVFSVDFAGMPGALPVISPSNGIVPFGFFFDIGGHLLVVEAGSMAVSSYDIMPNGKLKVISPSVVNGQTAACWIAGTQWGNVFTTNPGSMTISTYKDTVFNGNVTLVNATSATKNRPLDVGISNNGQFLYSLDPGNGGIDMFRIMPNGSLMGLGTVAGGFSIYAQGIAVQ